MKHYQLYGRRFSITNLKSVAYADISIKGISRHQREENLVTGGQRSVRMALLVLFPHHGDPATKQFHKLVKEDFLFIYVEANERPLNTSCLWQL